MNDTNKPRYTLMVHGDVIAESNERCDLEQLAARLVPCVYHRYHIAVADLQAAGDMFVWEAFGTGGSEGYRQGGS